MRTWNQILGVLDVTRVLPHALGRSNWAVQLRQLRQ